MTRIALLQLTLRMHAMTRIALLPLTLIVGFYGAIQAQQTQPPASSTSGRVRQQTQPVRHSAAPLGQAGASAQPQSSSRVIFRDGLLSVHAHNTNLADVLNAIQRKTGASFEFPSSAAQELVAVDLGPASPHDVLASLLNGSRFDYIVLGRTDDPNDIATVMLQEKSGPNGAVAATGTQPPVNAYQPPAEVQENADDVPTEIPDDTEQQQPPPPTGADQQNPKTPEQMLEELKRMQQQQGQQQGQQPNQQGQPQQAPQPQFPQTQPPLQGPNPQQPYPQQQQQQQQDDSEPQPH